MKDSVEEDPSFQTLGSLIPIKVSSLMGGKPHITDRTENASSCKMSFIQKEPAAYPLHLQTGKVTSDRVAMATDNKEVNKGGK